MGFEDFSLKLERNYNFKDFECLGGIRSGSARDPFRVRSGSVRGPHEVRSGFVRGPFRVRAGSVRDPFEGRAGSIRVPCGTRNPPQQKKTATLGR